MSMQNGQMEDDWLQNGDGLRARRVIHPSTNRAQRFATTSVRTSALSPSHCES